MIRMMTKAAALLLVATAAPVLAQAAPPPPGASPEIQRRIVIKRYGHDGRDDKGPGPLGGAMSGLTPEGRQILGDAMRESGRDSRDEVGDARRKVLELLDADRLDVSAMRRAMQEENTIVQRKHQARQEAMLAAYQKLSVRDRKAFATAMRAQTYRVEQIRRDTETRITKMREQWGRGGRDMPPPPPPPASAK